MDPGYVPHDAFFFTDQEEFSHRHTRAIWKNFDSIGSPRDPFSLPSNGDLASSSIIKSDRFGPKGTLLDLNKKALIDSSSALINIGPSGFQPFADIKEPEEYDETRQKDSPPGSRFRIALREFENNGELGPEIVEPIAECEASLEDIEDMTQRGLEILKLDSKLRSDKASDMSLSIEKKKSLQKIKVKNQGALKSLREFPKQENKISTEAFYSVPTMCAEENNQSRFEDNMEKDIHNNNEEDVRGEVNVLDRMSSGNRSPQGILRTDEEHLKFPKSNSSPRMEAYNNVGEETNKNGVVIRPLPILYRKQMSNKSESETKETQLNRINSVEADASMGLGKTAKKDMMELLDQTPIASLACSINKLPDNNDLKEGEAIYVERRYCNVCNLDQPIRAKHCRDCNRCVAKYDHHCPWLGTCIGEKNHFVFYWFLVFQIAEIAWAALKLYGMIWGQESSWRVAMGMLLLIPVTILLVLISSLCLFQTYLAMRNMTTWESLSWEKISYLKEWRIEWGSPFSQGLLKNLGLFCCHIRSPLRRWRLPKYKKRAN